MFDLTGRVAIVTGGSVGLGRQMAEGLAQMGANLVLCARKKERCLQASEELQRLGVQVLALACDVREPASIQEVVDTTVKQFGHIDILINNAGRSIRRPLAESLERWHDVDRTMVLNYYSPLRLIRGIAPGMLQRGDGHIINVATWGVFSEPSPLFAVYNASKAALSAVSRVIETEWATKGVHSTTLYYPLVATPMIAPTKEYQGLPALTSEEAAGWMITAARTRPVRIAPRMALAAQAIDTVVPGLATTMIRRQRLQPNRPA